MWGTCVTVCDSVGRLCGERLCGEVYIMWIHEGAACMLKAEEAGVCTSMPMRKGIEHVDTQGATCVLKTVRVC